MVTQHILAVPLRRKPERIAADALRDREFLERDIHRHAHKLRLELHPHRILQIRMRAGRGLQDDGNQTHHEGHAVEFHRLRNDRDFHPVETLRLR